ncbi:MAG: rRNA pseudouridine synthase [Defluviitaleaceae bacterium]|nr:rRNA pseudouridine synthase [Defluviitaleaceae bacterium]
MRLDKFLAHTGFGSRKEVKKLLGYGKVTINDEIAKRPETHLNPDIDEVRVDGEVIVYTKYVYVMLNKPAGVISASQDPEGSVTVSDVVEEETGLYGLFPVGRLDKDATGLIILTNDGQFSHRCTSPKKNVKKVYLVTVSGVLDDNDVFEFERGIVLDDGYECRPAALEILESGAESRALVTLAEGKFHQVKRMFVAVGKRVVTLKRVSFAGISLPDDLEEGHARPLSSEDLEIVAPFLAKD